MVGKITEFYDFLGEFLISSREEIYLGINKFVILLIFKRSLKIWDGRKLVGISYFWCMRNLGHWFTSWISWFEDFSVFIYFGLTVLIVSLTGYQIYFLFKIEFNPYFLSFHAWSRFLKLLPSTLFSQNWKSSFNCLLGL